jgi:hypothetical protein
VKRVLDFIVGVAIGAFGGALFTVFVLAAIYMSGESNNE